MDEYNNYKEAVIALSRACDVGDMELENYNKALSKTRIHIMSDSIVIASPDEYAESLAVVIDLCSVIQEQLYDLEQPVWVRGAIAVGEFYVDNNLVFGKAMVDAYIAQENYAVFPRIIFSEKICKDRKVSVEKNRVMPKTLSGDFDSEFPTSMSGGDYICGDGRCRIEMDAMSGNVTIRKGQASTDNTF